MNILNPIPQQNIAFDDPNWYLEITIPGTLKQKANGKMITASFDIGFTFGIAAIIQVYGWLNEETPWTPFVVRLDCSDQPANPFPMIAQWPYPEENTSLDVSFIIQFTDLTHIPCTLSLSNFKIQIKTGTDHLPVLGIG